MAWIVNSIQTTNLPSASLSFRFEETCTIGYIAESNVTGGSPSCTLVIANGHRYCGVSVPPPPDGDGDGVGDADDACPAVPGPASNNGCPPPPDADGDGVPDATDQCINVPGVAPDGCPPPDTDGDGIPDPNDSCDTERGPGYNNGCPVPPDQDGDGVSDETDQCDDQPGPSSNNGCPVPSTDDADGDGVLDIQDLCPSEAGTSFSSGCPDRDADLVSDAGDQCPDIAGPVSNYGCPYGTDPVGPVVSPEAPVPPTPVGAPDLKPECSAVPQNGPGAKFYKEPNSGELVQTLYRRVDTVMIVVARQGEWVSVKPAPGSILLPGWTLASELEHKSPCASFPWDSTDIPPATPDISKLEICPELSSDLNALPPEIQTIYTSSSDPCQMLADRRRERLVPGLVEEQTQAYLGTLFKDCPMSALPYLAVIDTLITADKDAAAALSESIEKGDHCENVKSFLAGNANTNGSIDSGMVVSCLNTIDAEHLKRVVALANQLGLRVDNLGSSQCYHITNLSKLGIITADQYTFYDVVAKTCGNSLSAINLLIYAIESGVDFTNDAFKAEYTKETFHCSQTKDLIDQYKNDPKNVPDLIKECPVHWVNLFMNAIEVRETDHSNDATDGSTLNPSEVVLPQHHPTSQPTWEPTAPATLQPTAQPTAEATIEPTVEPPDNEIDLSWLEDAADPCQAIRLYVLLGIKPKPRPIPGPIPPRPPSTPRPNTPSPNVTPPPRFEPPAEETLVPASQQDLPFYDLGGVGYFVGQNGSQSDIYQWIDQEVQPVIDGLSMEINETQPVCASECGWPAWIETANGMSVIRFWEDKKLASPIVIAPIGAYKLSLDTPLVWDVNHTSRIVWAIVLDPNNNNQPSVARFDADVVEGEAVQIAVDNATAFTVVGAFLVDIRDGQLERRFVGLVKSASLINPPGPMDDCHSLTPYDDESFLLVCRTTIYKVGLFDSESSSFTIEGKTEIHNIQRIPHLESFISFDDGKNLYVYSVNDGVLYPILASEGGSMQTSFVWKR